MSPEGKPHSSLSIAIIELDFHHDSVDGLIRIFQDHVAEVHVLTTAGNVKLLAGIDYNANVRFHEFSGISKYLFLKKNKTLLKACDIIFVNTIASDFGAFLAIPDMRKVILRIHNINKQFVPFRSIAPPKTLLAWWKLFSFFGRQVVLKLFPLFRVIINRKVQHFTFPDDGLRRRVLEKKYLPPHKVLPSIPLKVYTPSLMKPTPWAGELIVTVIGATDPLRRNYRHIVDAVKAIYSSGSIRMKLVFLGKVKGAYGAAIVEELNLTESPDFSFQTFPEAVSEELFNETLSRSHVVISPFVAETRTDIFREVYGQTKTSGSILDFLKFGIVTLTPAHYQPPAELAGFLLRYEDPEDLARQLVGFYNNPEQLTQLNAAAKDYLSAHYTSDAVFGVCENIFREIMKKAKP